MEGIFSSLYLVLQQKISSITANDKRVINMVKEDTGQLKDEKPALQYPCILVNFDDTSFSKMGDNCQMGVININLKLVCDVYSDSSSLAPLPVKVKALSYMEIEQKVYKSLQGWSPSDQAVPLPDGEDQPEGWSDVFGSLDRVAFTTNKDRDDLRVRDLIFSLGFEDYSMATRWETVTVTPDITDELDLSIPL